MTPPDPPRWASLADARLAHLDSWLRAVGSDASPADVMATLARDPDLAELAASWDRAEGADRQALAGRLDELFRRAAYASRPTCLRCGACCKNAGPTLYPGDEDLLARGVLRRQDLVTLRAGDAAFSHVEQKTVVLGHEQVRVASGANGGCPFLRPHDRGCGIHHRKPAQCVAQRCWDTAEAEDLARSPGLTRLDLLPDDHPARPLVQRHLQRCDPARFRRLALAAMRGDAQAVEARRAMVRHDEDLRRRAADLRLDRELPFLFGLPLSDE